MLRHSLSLANQERISGGSYLIDTPAGRLYSHTMDRSAESHLLQAAREGCSASFEKLVTMHTPRLLALARRLVTSHDVAEDIVQDAFLRLHRSLSTFRGDSLIGTWLYRTVTHLAIDHLRREKLRQRIFFFRSDADAPDPIDSARDTTQDPHGALVASELSSLLQQAMEKLSSRQRTVFVLRHQEGLSLREIGEILGLEEGTVKVHLHRATTALRGTLETYRETKP